MKRRLLCRSLLALAFALTLSLRGANPIITDVHTADPAALVHGDTVYLYTGHDEAPEKHEGYVMKEWLCFSSRDMVHWQSRGSPLSLKDFKWAAHDAWAGQVIERDGKFFWYVPMWMEAPRGFAIGVGISDSPTGPFKDALGHPLVTSDLTPNPTNPEGKEVTWDDIDPSVFIDDDGQGYLFWGNTNLYWAKLSPDMLHLEGAIQKIDLPRYVEAPWIHKHGNLYYLSYAYGFPERTAYATAEKVTGPWTYRGIIAELAGNCNTNHQAIIDFKGRSYFIYHNGGTPTGGSFRRSVCIDYLDYRADGTIKPVIATERGVVSTNEPRPASNTDDAHPTFTYVIAHGAWAGGWEFKKVDELLRADGNAVYRATYTGQGERSHLASPEVDLNTHIKDVVNLIQWEDLKNVVLVGHSYGGMVITGVIDQIPERIKQVIYLDAFLPEDGECLNATLGAVRPLGTAKDGFVSLGGNNDARPVPHIVPQSAKTFSQPISLRHQDVARKIPTTYILTADKISEPEKDAFYKFYQRAQARGWPTMIMEGSHVVHLTKPGELVKLLERIPEGTTTPIVGAQ